MRRFGVSTRLFERERLRREHLAAIAHHGFEALELFAAASHFDYHDPAALFELIEWLRETGMEMPSVHTPLLEAQSVLDVARRVPFTHLVVHLEGMSRDGAIRSLEDLQRIAEPLGVELALEVADNTLSTVDAL